jgi:hypothetical protein
MTSGYRSVGLVRSRTKATEFSLCKISLMITCLGLVRLTALPKCVEATQLTSFVPPHVVAACSLHYVTL